VSAKAQGVEALMRPVGAGALGTKARKPPSDRYIPISNVSNVEERIKVSSRRAFRQPSVDPEG
jgi:hypothetical protein